MSEIQFGTAGYRSLTATPAHIHAIGQAIVAYAQDTGVQTVLIGYDTRAMNPAYSQILAQLFQAMDIPVVAWDDPLPTPVIADTVARYPQALGVILTASHNPPAYTGLKLVMSRGEPAPESVTQVIQDRANQALATHAIVRPASPVAAFVTRLLARVTAHMGPRTGPPGTILVDARHGTAGPVWTEIAQQTGWRIIQHHASPRADFGGLEPNPLHPDGQAYLQTQLRTAPSNTWFGVAHDPDADRFLIVDTHGYHWPPERVCLAIATGLRETAPLYGLATTVTGSHTLAAFCRAHQYAYHETKTGFKQFTPFFEAAQAAGLTGLAVESSGGLSASWHTFEKCGFLPAVLLAVLCQRRQCNLAAYRPLLAAYDTTQTAEIALPLTPDQAANCLTQDFCTAVQDILPGTCQTRDGIKIILGPLDWVAWRLSGTEPVLRLYAESESDPYAYITQVKTLLMAYTKNSAADK